MVKNRIRSVLTAAVIYIMLPFILTMALSGVTGREVKELGADVRRVRINTERAVLEISVDDYIAGVLASRLIYGDNIELLKAEAVMLRTDIARKMKDLMCVDDEVLALNYLSEKERRTLWGNEYNDKEALIEDCISSVRGVVIRYDGQLIECPYTAVSSGKTRDGSSNAGHGYLISTDCPQDLEAAGYLTVVSIESSDFIKKCSKRFGSTSEDFANGINRNNPTESLQIVERDSADYVVKVKVGNIIVTGEELADALGVSSPCFYFENSGSSDKTAGVKVTVRGSGSGYGVSLYTAGRMAEEGRSYEEIIKFFYNGITLVSE